MGDRDLGRAWSAAVRISGGVVALFLLGVVFGFALVLVEKAFEEGDGFEEGVVEFDQQVDVVEIFLAVKTVGEVVAWVDRGTHMAALGTEEAEVAFAHFGGRAFAAQRGNRDGHRQVVANSAQQVGINHRFLQG